MRALRRGRWARRLGASWWTACCGAHLQGLDAQRLEAVPTLLRPLLETFVLGELLRAAAWSRTRPRLLHFRTAAGQEVDLVLEACAGRVVGVEVKAAAVGRGDLRGLRVLAEATDDRFACGVVLHLGDACVPLGERMWAVPLQSLWTSGAGPMAEVR